MRMSFTRTFASTMVGRYVNRMMSFFCLNGWSSPMDRGKLWYCMSVVLPCLIQCKYLEPCTQWSSSSHIHWLHVRYSLSFLSFFNICKTFSTWIFSYRDMLQWKVKDLNVFFVPVKLTQFVTFKYYYETEMQSSLKRVAGRFHVFFNFSF